MQRLLSSEKRTLDHWATVQFFFSVAQVRRFWRCFCFRSGLVALFLKMSERGDSWCTDSSFSSLLVKLSQVFESALLDRILKLAVIESKMCENFTFWNKLQEKMKNVFAIFNFLRCPCICMCIYIYIYIYMCVCVCVCVCAIGITYALHALSYTIKYVGRPFKKKN